MMKRIGRRLVSLLLTVVTVLTLLPAMTLPARAATSVIGLADKTIGLSYEGDEKATWNAGIREINGMVSSSYASKWIYRAQESTLTITNTKETPATLSFKYRITINNGEVRLPNRSYSSDGTDSFSIDLAKGASIEVYIKANGSYKSTSAQIEMTDVTLISEATPTVTFQPAVNGSYTVDETPVITEPYTHSKSSTTPYKVVAEPAPGYRFLGWYDKTNGSYINTNATAELSFEEDCTITARFASNASALFETKGQFFDDLTEAITVASKYLPATITLVNSGTITGDYTIPKGITLLIPFNEAKTVSNGEPKFTTSYDKPSTFRELTMTKESTLTVNGELVVGGQLSAAGTSDGFSGTPTGPHGAIIMPEGSAIIINGKLYAYGYISGPKDSTGKYTSGFNCGTVTVNSGGEVHEAFQIKDFRGGSASAGLVTILHIGKRVFPFSQYYVQNIEVPLTIHSGARDYAYSAVHALNKTNPTGAVCFIGNSGLFNITEGYITRTYVAKAPEGSTLQNDHVYYDVYGKIAMNSIDLKIAGYPISVKDFDLPINGNLSLRLFEHNGTGSEAVVNTPLALLPGFELYISKNSELTAAAPMYVYDAAEWYQRRYVFSSKYYDGNSGLTYTKASKGTTPKQAPSAQIDVNGTLTTSTGGVYTTEHGANIYSSEGTGKFIQSNAPDSTKKTNQYVQAEDKFYDIPITPAQLHNLDNSYTPTAGSSAGATFTYCTGSECGGGKWVPNLKVAAICASDGTQTETCSTLQEAVGKYSPDNNTAPTNYIKLLHSTTEKPISVNNKNLRLDLNGCTVTGNITVTSGYKLYGMDSTAGEDYVIAPSGKIVGTVTGCAPTYQTPGDTNDCYVAILSEENGTSTLSFHRFNISVTGYRFELAAPQCALFFIGKFQGDKAAKDYLKSLGFTLKVKGENGENDTQLGEDNYELPDNKNEIPKMPAAGEESTSKVVYDRDGDGAYLFEVYLKRSFKKGESKGYTEYISATAQATFKNGRTQQSDPRELSFQEAWTDKGLTTGQREILDKFLTDLGIK